MENELLPQLAGRKGMWTLGPTFTASRVMPGDGDLIAAGLPLDLKTTVKPGLDPPNLWQIIVYSLMDWDDKYKLSELGFFNARYGYFATWDIDELFDRLSGGTESVAEARREFREILTGQDVGEAAPESGVQVRRVSAAQIAWPDVRYVLGHDLRTWANDGQGGLVFWLHATLRRGAGAVR